LVQSHAGVSVASEEFASAVELAAAEHDLMLICDEAHTAFGRIGALFGFQVYGIKPDMITLGKAAGGGLPLGIVLLGSKAADVLTPGEHGSTLGGHALSCIAGLTMAKTIIRRGLVRQAVLRGEYLQEQLRDLQQRHQCVRAIRGRGLMLGVQLVSSAKEVRLALLQKSLLVDSVDDETLRLLPPLIVTSRQVQRAITSIAECLTQRF
jgi:acetylornithine/succinyldiaminopimelate/putrescine aminotransferase